MTQTHGEHGQGRFTRAEGPHTPVTACTSRAATTGKQQLSATAQETRTIRANWGYVRPESIRSRIIAVRRRPLPPVDGEMVKGGKLVLISGLGYGSAGVDAGMSADLGDGDHQP